MSSSIFYMFLLFIVLLFFFFFFFQAEDGIRDRNVTGVQTCALPILLGLDLQQVLPETTDPLEIEAKYEEAFATDPWYVHLYRTGHAYHGVHPFYMWYWGAHALQHLGAVIVVGGDRRAVKRLGFKPASGLGDALEMAEDVVGADPSITHLHAPPLLMAN